MMFLLADCKSLEPIIKLLKHGVIPLIQAAIIVVLIVLLIIDLGKAVMAGKEDEIKSAQKLAIKRVVYALAVFLVPWIVNLAIGLLANTKGTDYTNEGYQNADSALGCWAHTTTNGYQAPKTKQSGGTE